MTPTPARYETIAELLEQLGGIDPRRVRATPPPGQATEEDVLALLDRDNRLFELVDGVLVEKVMGFKESLIAGDILTELNLFVRSRDTGMVAGADGTLRLMPRLVRIPDVSFISWDQLPAHEYPSEPIPDLYPDLAVEVLSEGNTPEEMERKLKEYFLAGSRLVWLVDPDTRSVRVHTAPDEMTELREDDTLTGGAVLPGFALPLNRLFARVPRPAARKTTRKGKGARPRKRGDGGR
jgi:Uma2 family endonuclease